MFLRFLRLRGFWGGRTRCVSMLPTQKSVHGPALHRTQSNGKPMKLLSWNGPGVDEFLVVGGSLPRAACTLKGCLPPRARRMAMADLT